jgi:transposase
VVVLPSYSRREILNGIFYLTRSGGAWHLLPHDLPPWRTVYHYFWTWRRTGVWQQIHDRLREQVREAAGRNAKPSAAILDSQSIRISEAGGVRGYDGGKKIRGRKRHILVDTLGLLLLVVVVVVTAANVQDRNGAQLLLAPCETVPAPASDLGRWRLRGRAGSLDPRLTQMGQAPVRDCAETERTKRLCGSPLALAGGTDLRLAVSKSTVAV